MKMLLDERSVDGFFPISIIAYHDRRADSFSFLVPQGGYVWGFDGVEYLFIFALSLLTVLGVITLFGGKWLHLFLL